MHEFKLCAKDCSQTDTLAETLNIYCTDVSIDFGISNSSVLTMKWGNIVARTGIGLPTGETVTDLEEMDTNTLIFWSWMTSLETDKKNDYRDIHENVTASYEIEVECR